MDLLHFKDLGDTASVVTNEVVLVLGDIYPRIQLYCNVLGIDTMLCHFKVIEDGQTDRQRQYNSFATAH